MYSRVESSRNQGLEALRGQKIVLALAVLKISKLFGNSYY